MEEIWKDAPTTEGRILVSNLGNIKSKKRTFNTIRGKTIFSRTYNEITISPWIGNNGYYFISVKFINHRPKFLVHRLVALAFVEGYKEGLTVNHINTNKLDNRAENLEWVTLAKNTRLQWEDGLVNLQGSNHPASILTEEKVIEIKRVLASGGNSRELARKYKVKPPTIYSIKYGKTWAHIKI